ncbi:hypothetical protein NTE_02436 [Candidatus Nitrososphaera evergladensis SR1]|jgi:hypothetical protein|uniref:Exo-alpha-sialidase n=1 Tax=Candidatus Nitrososphaera evergladensis SR1 TaxID=1459636 RepID=A0A075MSD1_9ARCH|nr:sialidase family protein [Candidatus Nitrososphaera evergladensis]AIF84486.1 hypothetical protein NTE_02436 [Candidatus Nitrososphaera evergladensis SR1]
MRRAALLATTIIVAAAIVAAAGLTLVFSSGSFALSNKNANLPSLSYDGSEPQTGSSDHGGSNNNRQPAVVTSNNTSSVKFRDAINLTNNPNDSVYGQVASVNDSVYVVWQESIQDLAAGSNYDVFFKSSQDNGETFNNKTLNLSRNAGFSEHPQLAASGSNVFAVWTDNTFGKKQVFFAKSSDAGKTFDEPRVLSNSGNVSSYNQEMAVFGSNVYLVWQEQAPDDGGNVIIFRASSDNGNTFADPVTVARDSSNSSGIDSRAFPKVAAYGDNVYVAWSAMESENNPRRGLYFARSADSGSAFSSAAKLSSGNEVVGEAQIAAYGDNDVYIIWGGLDAMAAKNLFYVQSSDGGGTFAGPSSVKSLKSPSNVELAVMNGRLGSGDNDNNTGNGTSETAAYSLHVAAQVPLSPDNEEIMFVSNLGGNRTSAQQQPFNLSKNSGISECPSISISGNDVFVVWEDLTVGNHEIFLAKGKVAS